MISKPQKRKMNPMLFNVLLISGGLHALALFILGSITVYKYIIPDEAQFEEPPEVTEEEPPPEVKVEIKQPPAPQQQAMQNLSMKQVGNIAVEAVDVNLPSMQDSFTVSAGLGGFGGSGAILGGTRGSIGIGMSDVNLFGLKSSAERFLFVIDANRRMVTDAKGGLNSYKVIKKEVTDMVDNLSVGTLFNVMVVDGRRNKRFKSQLVPAGEEMHRQLVEWMKPINSDTKHIGLERARGTSYERLQALRSEEIHRALNRGGNNDAFMTQVALEQSIDSIFFITGSHPGFEGVSRRPTKREAADWRRTRSSSSYKRQVTEHRKEIPEMRKRVAKKLAEINKKRKADGKPPRVLASRHNVNSNARELGLKWETDSPPSAPRYYHSVRDVEKYFKELLEVLYLDKGGEKPTVNVILFLAGDEKLSRARENQLKDYVRLFSGKYRIIRGLDEIKSARSAKDTKN